MLGSTVPTRQLDDLDLADSVCHQLHRFIRLIGRKHTQLPKVYDEGIERVGFVLLTHLALEGPSRTTTLAEAVHSDISTVSRQVTALVKRGLIERRPDPLDGRACLLAATAEGQGVFERIRNRRNEHVAKLLASWPLTDRQQLIRLLARFNDDFEEYLPRAVDEFAPHGPSNQTDELDKRKEKLA